MTTPRPEALPVVSDNIPQALRDVARWLVWKYHWKSDRGQWTKVPCNPAGGFAAVDNSATWTDFGTAYCVYDLIGGYDGVGFVFTDDDNLVGGDFDACLDPDTGARSATAIDALKRIGGYWERSPSGRGLHVITRAPLARAYRDHAQGIELYPNGRFFTVTGHVFDGRAELPDARQDLQPFIDAHFPARRGTPRASATVPGDKFFRNVNDAAMRALDAWVPVLFPQAEDYHAGYRISSASLGRPLQEDISIVPEGIVDFGVADMGDERQGRRTPIDLVIEWLLPDEPLVKMDVREAAFWLCERLGVEPATLGWKGKSDDYRACTEFGNAQRMLDRYGPELMYVPELQAWFRWSGVHWVQAFVEEIEHRAKQTVHDLPDEDEKFDSKDERIAFLRFCAASQTAKMVRNMVRLASSSPRVLASLTELDRNMDLLGVGNGAVDLRTGGLIAPDKAHRITITTNVDYDPTARAPLFEQTVSDVFFGDAEQIEFFQRLCGYALCGDPKEDVLVIPHGGGSNGKSTVLGAIREVLGRHARSASAETFTLRGPALSSAGGPREDILRLRGSRFVYVNEPEENCELRESLIKSMTGGDPLPARGMHAKSTVEVLPTWVAFMPTNHRPIVKGTDHAIWRRLMLVPFTRNFDHDDTITKDPLRSEKLRAEAAGILAWLVRGALAYRRLGLRPPGIVARARASYREDMDLLAEWIDECCEVGGETVCASGELWQSWRMYAEQHGELRLVPNARSLGRQLTARGFESIRDSRGLRGRGFAGIQVKASVDFEAHDLL